MYFAEGNTIEGVRIKRRFHLRIGWQVFA